MFIMFKSFLCLLCIVSSWPYFHLILVSRYHQPALKFKTTRVINITVTCNYKGVNK